MAAVYMGTLTIQGTDYNVVSCQTHFTIPSEDKTSDTEAVCDRIQITLDIDDTDDLKIQQWYTDREMWSGQILINIPKEDDQTSTEARIIIFQEAFCYLIKDNFIEDSSHIMTIEFVPRYISPGDNLVFFL